MRLLKRLVFAITHDIDPDYIVVPFGDKLKTSRFTKYNDALEWAAKNTEPQYPIPSVLVRVRK